MSLWIQDTSEVYGGGRDGACRLEIRVFAVSQMKDSFEIEKTIKIQEEELTDLQNNYKLLKNTFQETRKKSKADWQVQMEANARRRKEEKEGVNRRIAELQKKVDYLK